MTKLPRNEANYRPSTNNKKHRSARNALELGEPRTLRTNERSAKSVLARESPGTDINIRYAA